jgi:4-diphosphocytidyl-2-C-methyl-D-erythritol kinase
LSIAAALGADIPFLVSRDVMALAWGHGERMLALRPLPQRDVLLVTPEVQVATAEAYAWLDKDRSALGGPGEYETADLLATEQVLADWHALAHLSRNSFLSPVAARHPQIRTLLDQLKKTEPFLCGMSGSGSTLFGVYERPFDAGATTAFEGAATTATRTSTQVVQPIRIG